MVILLSRRILFDPFLNLWFRHFDDLKKVVAYSLSYELGIGMHLDKSIFISPICVVPIGKF